MSQFAGGNSDGSHTAGRGLIEFGTQTLSLAVAAPQDKFVKKLQVIADTRKHKAFGRNAFSRTQSREERTARV
jgi:hypothetical protein